MPDNFRDNENHGISIFAYPAPTVQDQNPYLKLFYGAVKAQTNAEISRLQYNDGWLDETAGLNRTSLKLIHFHWPENMFAFEQSPNTVKRIRNVIGFFRYLKRAKRLGFRIVWTVHNLTPHEKKHWATAAQIKVLMKLADLLICHTDDTAASVKRLAPQADIIVVPHGNYGREYDHAIDWSDLCNSFGLEPHLPLISCVGRIRDYKGFSFAANALAQQCQGYQVLFAGSPDSQSEVTALQRICSQSQHAHIIARDLSVAEFGGIVSHSKSVVLPYQRITGSGALLAVWTCGSCVVAPDLPLFQAMYRKHPAAISLYKQNNPAELRNAIHDTLDRTNVSINSAAQDANDYYDWERCITPLVQWLGHQRSSNAEMT